MRRPKCLIITPLEQGGTRLYLHVGGEQLSNTRHIYALVDIKDYNRLQDQLDVALRALGEYTAFNPADRVVAERAIQTIHQMKDNP